MEDTIDRACLLKHPLKYYISSCDESSYLNGSTFLVDGGITAAYVTPE